MAINVDEYYRKYGPMVLRRCRRMLKNEDLAVDAMQDTFVQLLRYKDRLEGDAPSSLLFRMATNVCLNKIRSMNRKPEDRDEQLLAQIASFDDSEGRSIARSLLDKIFAAEKESTKTIAVMHYVDGMTLQEVADQSGLSVSGVRKRLRTLSERVQGWQED